MKHYGAILADPPWNFKTYSAKGRGRSADRHYKITSFEAICEMRLRPAKDCVLFLWVTDPSLLQGLQLIEEWGFKYKTVAFTWAKTGKDPQTFPMGCGYWTRANPEMCLLATRGHPKRKARGVQQLVLARRREHSRKPDEVYGKIEALVDGPYLELFSRTDREGWDCWGAEAGKWSVP